MTSFRPIPREMEFDTEMPKRIWTIRPCWVPLSLLSLSLTILSANHTFFFTTVYKDTLFSLGLFYLYFWRFLCHIKLILHKSVCFPLVNLSFISDMSAMNLAMGEERNIFPSTIVVYFGSLEVTFFDSGFHEFI